MPAPEYISWKPIVKGGSNFRTHKLKQVSHHSYKIVPTLGYYLCILLFILLSGGMLYRAYMEYLDSTSTFWLYGILGAIFQVPVLQLIYNALSPFTIDLDEGVFYNGREWDPIHEKMKEAEGSVQEIYGIQLVTELVTRKSRYESYELNLVLQDGRRINVMDHGNQEKLYEDAELLSEALKVPILQPN